ncbi:hypothetical protein EYS42_11595 [Aquabacterium lacunae]|uniref:Uncharacterized protein n=1 Tax=Aquabacterium lacunae TaxID=2528630 RepID=A0A4Q9GXJ4_9BURK|nr:hypothetical protein [Aquabacterium lacunae]TBO30327.1 hypothetical protein EYS42_11595 [Aquabacterium lacunae]
MPWLIWGVFAALVGLTALGTWGLTALLEAALPALGDSPEAMRQVLAQWQPPEWLGWLVDTGSWAQVQQAGLWVLEMLSHAGPYVGGVASWLGPLMWVLWALFSVVLLVVAGGLHALVTRPQSVLTPRVVGGLAAAGRARVLGGPKMWLALALWQRWRRQR